MLGDLRKSRARRPGSVLVVDGVIQSGVSRVNCWVTKQKIFEQCKFCLVSRSGPARSKWLAGVCKRRPSRAEQCVDRVKCTAPPRDNKAHFRRARSSRRASSRLCHRVRSINLSSRNSRPLTWNRNLNKRRQRQQPQMPIQSLCFSFFFSEIRSLTFCVCRLPPWGGVPDEPTSVRVGRSRATTADIYDAVPLPMTPQQQQQQQQQASQPSQSTQSPSKPQPQPQSTEESMRWRVKPSGNEPEVPMPMRKAPVKPPMPGATAARQQPQQQGFASFEQQQQLRGGLKQPQQQQQSPPLQTGLNSFAQQPQQTQQPTNSGDEPLSQEIGDVTKVVWLAGADDSSVREHNPQSNEITMTQLDQHQQLQKNSEPLNNPQQQQQQQQQQIQQQPQLQQQPQQQPSQRNQYHQPPAPRAPVHTFSDKNQLSKLYCGILFFNFLNFY